MLGVPAAVPVHRGPGQEGPAGADTPQETLLQAARALQHSAEYDQYRRHRVVAEHRLARLEQLGIRQARDFGRVKTKFQLYLAATVANLTLPANQAGAFGDPDNDDYAFATGGAVGGDCDVVGHLLPTWILAWLRSTTVALSLFPTRAFQPDFQAYASKTRRRNGSVRENMGGGTVIRNVSGFGLDVDVNAALGIFLWVLGHSPSNVARRRRLHRSQGPRFRTLVGVEPSVLYVCTRASKHLRSRF